MKHFQLLTVRKAAEMAHVSEDTIRRHLRDGHLPGLRFSPRGQWRIPAEAMANWHPAQGDTAPAPPAPVIQPDEPGQTDGPSRKPPGRATGTRRIRLDLTETEAAVLQEIVWEFFEVGDFSTISDIEDWDEASRSMRYKVGTSTNHL